MIKRALNCDIGNWLALTVITMVETNFRRDSPLTSTNLSHLSQRGKERLKRVNRIHVLEIAVRTMSLVPRHTQNEILGEIYMYVAPVERNNSIYLCCK